MNNLASLWYVNVSMVLYFFTPFFMLAMSRTSFVFTMAVLVVIMTYQICFLATYYQFLHIGRCFSYPLGMMFFYIQREYKEHLTPKNGIRLIGLSIILLILGQIGGIWLGGYPLEMIPMVVIPLGIMILGFIALPKNHRANKMIQNSFFDFVSKISYGLYVFHAAYRDLRPEVDKFFTYGPSDYPDTNFYFAVDVLSNYLMFVPLAYLSLRFLELPCADYGNSLQAKISPLYIFNKVKLAIVLPLVALVYVYFYMLNT